MKKGLKLKDLQAWVGRVGWVYPERRHKTATIAVKVIGVNFAYGRWLFEVAPLAGTGSWQTAADAVEFEPEVA